LSAASQGVAQVVKDAGTGVQGVHEIQVTLRKYEFSPGLLRVKKGETGQANHDRRGSKRICKFAALRGIFRLLSSCRGYECQTAVTFMSQLVGH
jgi:hypothetical protein